MKLEAHDANKEKQLELAPGCQAMLAQLRVMLNRFSLLSVKAGCDSPWVLRTWGHSRRTGRHGDEYPCVESCGDTNERNSLSPCEKEKYTQKDMKIY